MDWEANGEGENGRILLSCGRYFEHATDETKVTEGK